MTLFFQEPGGTTARNIISHCGVSKTQEKPTGKCFVPENDVKIIHISESLLSPAKHREFGMKSHSQVTFIGQIIERSSINEEATQELWIVNIQPLADLFP